MLTWVYKYILCVTQIVSLRKQEFSNLLASGVLPLVSDQPCRLRWEAYLRSACKIW